MLIFERYRVILYTEVESTHRCRIDPHEIGPGQSFSHESQSLNVLLDQRLQQLLQEVLGHGLFPVDSSHTVTSSAEGRADTFQPPPRALIRSTLAAPYGLGC
jgi:hypothetical protein